VMMVLRPGEFSLHNTLLVHGSDPNPSDDRRIGFVARFIPTHVRQIQAGADTALLVRGVDDYHHFEHEISPDGDYTPGVRAYHAQLAQRRKGVVLQEEIAGAERPGRWS